MVSLSDSWMSSPNLNLLKTLQRWARSLLNALPLSAKFSALVLSTIRLHTRVLVPDRSSASWRLIRCLTNLFGSSWFPPNWNHKIPPLARGSWYSCTQRNNSYLRRIQIASKRSLCRKSPECGLRHYFMHERSILIRQMYNLSHLWVGFDAWWSIISPKIDVSVISVGAVICWRRDRDHILLPPL